MGSSDSGVESNADVEMMAEAHKGRQAGGAQSTEQEPRNAAVVSPSESSTSDVSGNSNRRRRQEVRNDSTSRQDSNENEENEQEDPIEDIDEEGDVEDDIEEIEEVESRENDEDEYRHNSSVGEESSASFARESPQGDCIVCGVCRRQFPLNQFASFIEHKTTSGCRQNSTNNNGKRSPSDESAPEVLGLRIFR